MERNPYFFGVDSAGKQLPYVDQVVHEYAALERLIYQWVSNGNLDFQARHINSGKLAFYQQNATDGDYQVVTGVSSGHLALQLNLTTREPQLRTFFQDQRVRIALSVAVDRETLNQEIYGGIGTPRQYSPLTRSPQFHAPLTNAHIGYDTAQANTLLDRGPNKARGIAIDDHKAMTGVGAFHRTVSQGVGEEEDIPGVECSSGLHCCCQTVKVTSACSYVREKLIIQYLRR